MICSSGKSTYSSRSKAKHSAKFIKRVGKRRLTDSAILRPYRCPKCGWWHLTSRNPVFISKK
jgi:hypothetical protein